jgi:hypothetical protein
MGRPCCAWHWDLTWCWKRRFSRRSQSERASLIVRYRCLSMARGKAERYVRDRGARERESLIVRRREYSAARGILMWLIVMVAVEYPE